MTGPGAWDVLTYVHDRPCLLGLLREGAFDRHDVEAELDVSRFTAHRVLHTLRDFDVITKRNGGYEVTPLGEVVVEEAVVAQERVNTAQKLGVLLELAESHDNPIDVDAFTDSTVRHRADEQTDLETRMTESISDASEIRCAGKTIVGHRFLAAVIERIGDADVEIVVTEDVVEFVSSTHPALSTICSTISDADLAITDTVPFHVLVVDDQACIGVYDETALRINRLIETDDETAIDWANRYFESFMETGSPLQLEDDVASESGRQDQ